MGDKTRGMYQKFVVTRTDDKSEPGQKHDGCFYFVLDCDHDPHALRALEAYRRSCQKDYPLLAADILDIVMKRSFGDAEGKTEVQK